MKGIHITTSGVLSVRDYDAPLYKSIGKDVGGYIELAHPLQLPEGFLIVVNEEGLLMDLEYNLVASVLNGGHLVGDAVIMKEGIVDGEPDIVGLEQTDVDIINNMLDLHLEV